MQSIYEMTKDLPAFKSFCRRRSTVKRESWETTFAKLRKKRASEFKSFCKPKGINSILKENEFTTGYSFECCQQYFACASDIETRESIKGDVSHEERFWHVEHARIIKVKGEFITVIDELPSDSIPIPDYEDRKSVV